MSAYTDQDDLDYTEDLPTMAPVEVGVTVAETSASVETVAETAIPAHVRRWGYLGLTLGSPLVAYAQAQGWLGVEEVTMWSAYCVMFGATAFAHSPRRKDKSRDEPRRKRKRANR